MQMRGGRGIIVTIGALLALVAASTPASPKSAPPRRPACTDKVEGTRPFRVPVGPSAEIAHGRVAFPAGAPKTLVVYGHGYGHTSASWVHHLEESARRGFLAVVMDYRGLKIIPDDDDEDNLPSSRGWNAMAGAEDIIRAAQFFELGCDSIETVVSFGVSMGGNMSGLAVALAGERELMKFSPDDDPLFDYWFDIEGAVNLIETYNESRLAGTVSDTAVRAQEDIEAETGGSFEEEPAAYEERSVVARGDDLASAGLDGVVMVHALNDGLVPYNQSVEMSSVLLSRSIDFDFFTVSLRDADSEKETTITGYVTDNFDPDYRFPLAGHASEKSTTHIVMQLAFERLWALVEGEAPGPARFFTANGDLGVFPPP